MDVGMDDTGVEIFILYLGAGSSPPKLYKNFNVFRLIVWRSTAAKRNEVRMTLMPRFLGRGILKLTCVTDPGYLAG